jgi:hypothetical protein
MKKSMEKELAIFFVFYNFSKEKKIGHPVLKTHSASYFSGHDSQS